MRIRPTMLVWWGATALSFVVLVASTWSLVAARGRVVEPKNLSAGAPTTLIVLGAKAADGEPGTYLRNRLDVAVQLYRAGRVDRILNSGNDSDDAGREVRTMRAYLEAAGVPAVAIVDDPIGMNTAATCRRSAEEFGVRRALIVTQGFHVGRAVGLCRAEGIDVTGVIAPCDGCTGLSLVRNYFREALLSRPRAMFNAFGVGQICQRKGRRGRPVR
ncbi:YdcF family protein [Gordonia alkaliphila]|uniref:SanA/YdcF family protein n=1 Tax=Gordonia alkaliphila TaxID=1053547 RepID=UPI001FF2F5CE|nr:YdcF family protein [Gordonia alkaliphila]MCK0439336.1 YdcF family protein [Gordonia alkaliphila]